MCKSSAKFMGSHIEILCKKKCEYAYNFWPQHSIHESRNKQAYDLIIAIRPNLWFWRECVCVCMCAGDQSRYNLTKTNKKTENEQLG